MIIQVEGTTASPDVYEVDSVEEAINEYIKSTLDGEQDTVTDYELWVTIDGGETVKYVARVTITVIISGIVQKDWT